MLNNIQIYIKAETTNISIGKNIQNLMFGRFFSLTHVTVYLVTNSESLLATINKVKVGVQHPDLLWVM